MKLVIASDIHGSATWCERLFSLVKTEQPDKLVLLGDLLYHGPRNALPDGYDPAHVAELLNSMAQHIIAVRGNCEAEVDQMVLDFSCMSDYAIIYDGYKQLFITHGHLSSPTNLPPLPTGSTFVYGHTHIKHNETVDGIHLFNPGSIGIPKDDTHSCGIYENGIFTHHILA